MNYKICVENEAESKEAQCLFFELGYRWLGGSSYFKINDNFKYITAYMRGMSLAQGTSGDAKKEITMLQLRDMVVLKRNDVGDATHKGSITDNVYYVSSDEEVYRFESSAWCFSTVIVADLKPIEKKEMKEYLRKNSNGTYSYIGLVHTDHVHYFMIEIPEGADTLAGDSSTRYFWKHGVGEKGNMIIGVGESLARYSGWTDCKDSADEWLGQINCEHSRILWQRETLNDKVASAEVARQSGMFVGTPFSDLSAFNFGAIDDFVESNVEQGAKHSHYKKDISHLNTLDIYRVTELFNPHSCGAHIAKKALCSGQRGHKDLLTDIQDIIDTAERWKEMLIEDEKAK